MERSIAQIQYEYCKLFYVLQLMKISILYEYVLYQRANAAIKGALL